jgi:hypothetical protein
MVHACPCYQLGTIGTVRRAYEGMKEREYTNKEMKKIAKYNTK